MRHLSLVRSIIILSVLATGCDSSRETTEPSPDRAVPPELLGTRLVYTRFSPGVPRLVVMDATGAGAVELSQPATTSRETTDW